MRILLTILVFNIAFLHIGRTNSEVFVFQCVLSIHTTRLMAAKGHVFQFAILTITLELIEFVELLQVAPVHLFCTMAMIRLDCV